MLFLLLRLLTTLPTQQVPPHAIAAPPVVAVVRPQTAADASALRAARTQLAAIEGAPAKIRTFMRGAQDDPFRTSCVAQRLAEAQVHATLARGEMNELTAPDRTPGDRAHASRRLELLEQRTSEVERAARLCVDVELSSISAVKVEVEVPPAAARAVDVTEPPDPNYPCPSSATPCTVIPRAP